MTVAAELAFEKWEGLGNDFVLVRHEDRAMLTGDLAPERLCDRHLGVGADGVLIASAAPPGMVVHNADGTRPEMCGNGVRCVAAWASAAQPDAAFLMATDAGDVAVRVEHDGPGRAMVEVAMGSVSFVPGDAGVRMAPTSPGLPVAVDADGLRGWIASIGNPHWIFVEPDGADIGELGPRLERDQRFARRTNVEFVRRIGERSWRVDVWERGVGRTLACGSGAVSVGATLVALGYERAGDPIRVELPGGALDVWTAADGVTWMRGPARRVFVGRI